MREVMHDIDRWLAAGQSVALATVISTWGSAPRKVGAKMALTPDGQLSGSVSGGCVEGAVFEAGVESLENRRPQLLHFGVADETAWEVGLACGGSIQVFVEPLDREPYQPIQQRLEAEEPVAAATIISGPDHLLGRKYVVDNRGLVAAPGDTTIDEAAVAAAQLALHRGQPTQVSLGPGPDAVEVFVDVLLPSPSLIIVGGVHIAVALTSIAKTLGFRTIVIDPRRSFGNLARFPHVDQLIQQWPNRVFPELRINQATAIATLTHDPKIDDPALQHVLPSDAFYIGALGSPRTHARRVERLLDAGLSQEQIGRIHAPIGLDINAQTPEEIAVAVMAQIVAAWRAPRTGSARRSAPETTE